MSGAEIALILGSNCISSFGSFYLFDLILRPGKISFICSEYRGLVCFSGPGFKVREIFSGYRFGGKVSLPLSWVPFLVCVSFRGLGLRANQFRD